MTFDRSSRTLHSGRSRLPFQDAPQLGSRPRQTRFDRAGRDFEDSADLCDREILQEIERQDFAFGPANLLQSEVNEFCIVEPDSGRQLVVDNLFESFLPGAFQVGVPVAVIGHYRAACDGIQPRCQPIRLPKASETSKDMHPNILEQMCCSIIVVDESPHVVPQSIVITVDKLIPGTVVAPPATDDQKFVIDIDL
jgi:hypothetical protein